MMSQLIEHDMFAFFLETFTPITPMQNFNPLTKDKGEWEKH